MQDYSVKNKKNKKTIKILIEGGITIGVFIILFIAGYILLNYIIAPLLIHGKGKTKVPNIIGKSVEEAEEILKDYDLKLEITEERTDTIYPSGVIIYQRPKEDKTVRKGRNIYVVLSKGKEKVRVPNIIGLSLNRGLELLNRANLKVKKIDTVSVDTAKAGVIVSLHPAPDQYVKKGTNIYVTISSEIEKEGGFPIPNLIGLTLIEAKKIIENDSLVLGKVEEIESEGESGKVILQSPNYGVTVFPGDTIKLFVSKKR